MAQVGIQLPSTAACIKYCIKPQNCLKLSWLWIIWLIWDLEPTSASYSNIWLPFMWWHLSMRTGPLRRETSRHRSSVLISLSAVYENTWATTKEIKQGCDYYHHTFVKWKSRKPSFFTWFPPMPWQLKKPTFSFSFLPMLSTHWLVSTFLIWRGKGNISTNGKNTNMDPPNIDVNLRRGLFKITG